MRDSTLRLRQAWPWLRADGVVDLPQTEIQLDVEWEVPESHVARACSPEAMAWS